MATKKTNTGHPGAVLATLAGITAAAIGGYFLYGHRDADKNRAKVKGWMLRAKGEVLDELEKVGEVTESVYGKAVDAVVQKYKELKNIEPEELESFIEEMKEHWSGIQRSFGAGTKTKTAKAKTARRSSKK